MAIWRPLKIPYYTEFEAWQTVSQEAGYTEAPWGSSERKTLFDACASLQRRLSQLRQLERSHHGLPESRPAGEGRPVDEALLSDSR
jgi:hypothetical protein